MINMCISKTVAALSVLLVMILCSAPVDAIEKGRAKTWLSYMKLAERDLHVDDNKAGTNCKVNPKGLEHAKVNLLKAARLANITIATLQATKDKEVSNNLGRLTADCGLWTAQYLAVAEAAHKDQKNSRVLLPYLRQCLTVNQQILQLDEKCFGKTNSTISQLQNGCSRLKHSIGVLQPGTE